MPKAAIYARVSTSDGKQDFNRQLNELKALCKQHDYKDSQIEEYAEAISGYKKEERLQLQAMLEKVESNPKEYKCIYTSEISRIGRNPTETRRIIDRLTDLGVPVYIQSLNQFTIDGSGKRNMIMNIILQVLMEYANLEAETFKTRSKSGLLKSAKEGKAGGGLNLPYGYTKDENKFLVVDSEEADVIEEIFNLYKDGNGIKVISNILNDKKVPTRLNKAFSGKTINFKIKKNASKIQWSDKQIHDILRNTIYIGQRRFKGEIFKAPEIISEDLFNECNAIMQGKTHRNYLTSYTYLLKDIMVCGCCGRNMFARYKPDKIVNGKNKAENYYMCSSRLLRAGNCGNHSVNISLIESAIYHQLVNSNLILKYLSNTSGIKIDLQASIKKLEQSLLSDTKLLEEKVKEKERLLNVYLKGSIPESTFTERQASINDESSSVSNRIELAKKELNEKKKALANLNNPKTNKKTLVGYRDNRTQLQGLYKQVIKKIIINKLDASSVLATIYLTLNGVELKNSLKLMLDLSGMRRKPIEYRYRAQFKMESDPVYKNNILMNKAMDIYEEFLGGYEDWDIIQDVLTVE